MVPVDGADDGLDGMPPPPRFAGVRPMPGSRFCVVVDEAGGLCADDGMPGVAGAEPGTLQMGET
jgi:hypothetical protein